jgi:hypothetical protein
VSELTYTVTWAFRALALAGPVLAFFLTRMFSRALAGRLFFATRQDAEHHLHREERERAEQAAPQPARIKRLRRAMADAHPDRGSAVEQFIQPRRRYQTALRPSPAT